MPDVPAWLTPILQQFPIVALVLGVAWLVLKWADGRREGELARLDRQREREAAGHAAELERLTRIHAAAVQRGEAEIARLIQERQTADARHAAEIERLQRSYEARGREQRSQSRLLERLLANPPREEGGR